MPEVGFGGGEQPNGWSGDSPLFSGGIPMPVGRQMANGSQAVIINSISAYIAGRGAARNVQLTLGGSQTGVFTVGTAGAGVWTGMLGSSAWLVQGGTQGFRIDMTGTIWFLRGGGGQTSDNSGYVWGGTLGGSYGFVQAPTAPQNLTATPSPTVEGAIVLNFQNSADNGGTGVTSFNIYRNGVFIGNTTSGAYAVFNNTPGVAYNFTVRARNWVTDAAGTDSVNSNTATATAPGVPSAPRTLTATPSTLVPGQVNLSWTAPAQTVGAITGYNIFRDGVQVASTSGTATTFNVPNNTKFTSYSFTVKARNAFADANKRLSPDSNSVSVTAQGVPTPTRNLAGVANTTVPGQIDLTWQAPVTAGTGGVTGYRVYFSTGALATTVGNTLATSVTGLNPGQTYSFYVRALNALATASGTEGESSNTVTIQALGEPPAPSNFTAVAGAAFPNRITLSWTPPAGTVTGYNVFERNTNTNVDTLLGTTTATTYRIDGLAAGTSRTYVVRARNSYTDTLSNGYPGNWGGPATAPSTATPTSDSVQTVPNLSAVVDTTNQTFNGTYTINALTPTTLRYAKTAPNVATVLVSSGTVTDNTNASFNGTVTVLGTPSPSSISYTKVAANVAATPMSGGVVTNTTNQVYNGTYVVTAVNVVAKTVSYAKTNANIASRAVPVNALPAQRATISNQTNAVYNGTSLTITSIPTPTTLRFAKTNADIAESNAAGTVVNTTNRDGYNGVRTIIAVTSHNTVTYATSGATQSAVLVTNPPGGIVYRTVSPAKLDIKYRSGWAG